MIARAVMEYPTTEGHIRDDTPRREWKSHRRITGTSPCSSLRDRNNLLFSIPRESRCSLKSVKSKSRILEIPRCSEMNAAAREDNLANRFVVLRDRGDLSTSPAI
jgi:hypothetical protein